ncbi:HupE/UreJ family protein [Hufsiella ginkgonis]|uniref:HupE/UreJ family protein n=1 Tax=Hufsiella ginkgonis TaxID=2695274 RepID=A0A7K1XY97_9SPHI|nr:HupE/UreJ family protein [Hufsiella ginkgonis]MXV15817.1 hypothetical protein [Hufsiella ginkgonis]
MRLKFRLLIFFALQLVSTPGAFAHRLNEYLQATTISLSRDKVVLGFHLTPGVDVALAILKIIDLNNDHQISEAEEQGYLKMLSHDLLVSIDGHSTTLHLSSFSFPAVRDFSKGTGSITINYEGDIDQQKPSHTFILKNRHYPSIAVYLVNCLLPADPSVHVTSQTRNTNQSIYQLDFTTGPISLASTADQLKSEDHQAVVKTYFLHGIKHILTGYDHLLFLCALVLGAAGLWDLIKVVTAFTIAHSLTLTLAALGYAHLPQNSVEPIIAASIVFVAIQNVAWPNQAKGYSRITVAFFFGLFHGLGFAGGLLELMHAMPEQILLYAILGFSLGVEAGNQIVLLPLYGVLRWLGWVNNDVGNSGRWPTVRRYASGAVGIAGLYYFCNALMPLFNSLSG